MKNISKILHVRIKYFISSRLTFPHKFTHCAYTKNLKIQKKQKKYQPYIKKMNKRNYKIAINIIRSISLIRVSREEKKGPRNTVPKKKKNLVKMHIRYTETRGGRTSAHRFDPIGEGGSGALTRETVINNRIGVAYCARLPIARPSLPLHIRVSAEQ